jgi:hypothetical protein
MFTLAPVMGRHKNALQKPLWATETGTLGVIPPTKLDDMAPAC